MAPAFIEILCSEKVYAIATQPESSSTSFADNTSAKITDCCLIVIAKGGNYQFPANHGRCRIA